MDTVRTRTGFAALPLELKASIVSMLNEAERNWQGRCVGLKQDDQAVVGHVYALSAIALVNKEFRELAARHQFRVLDSRRSLLRPFRFYILARYGAYIEEVHLNDNIANSQSTLENTLSILHQLPSLRTLIFTLGAARILFGLPFSDVEINNATLDDDDYNTAEDWRCHRDVLKPLGVTALRLEGFTPSEASTVAQLFPNLQNLVLVDFDRYHDDGVKLSELLGLLPRLTQLCLEAASEGGVLNWPVESADVSRNHLPPITSLEIHKFTLDLGLTNFVASFGSTLEALLLNVFAVGPLPDPPLIQLDLPRLTELHLGHYEDRVYEEPWNIFIPFENVHLTELSYAGAFDNELPDEFIIAFLKEQSDLRVIRLGALVPLSPLFHDHWHLRNFAFNAGSLAAYTKLLRERSLDTSSVSDQSHFSPYKEHVGRDSQYCVEDSMRWLTDALARTLDFGRHELDRIRAEKDEQKAEEWLEMLRPLEMERLSWKD
ncbi:hypothetical protein P7C70_g5157, partial [Phenoliferia sp. Uapishka_3]